MATKIQKWTIVQKTWRFWQKYPPYQWPSRCQISKPAKPLLWNQKLIQERNVGRNWIRCHIYHFFRNLIAMMYRKTSKWINTIGYTNKNINNINTNKRMKTNIKSVIQYSNTYTNINLHKTYYIDLKKCNHYKTIQLELNTNIFWFKQTQKIHVTNFIY